MDLRTWTTASRVRYALVHTGINGAIVFGVAALGGVVSSSYLSWAIPALVLAFLVHGWVWYPRAKRRPTAPPG